MLLRRRRARSSRHRRPGRTIAIPPPLLAPVEKTLATVGAATAPTVELVDEALRRLRHPPRRAPTSRCPTLAAVELSRHRHHPAPQPPPTPCPPRGPTWATGAAGPARRTPTRRPSASSSRTSPRPTRCWSPSAPATPATLWLLTARTCTLTLTGDPTYGRRPRPLPRRRDRLQPLVRRRHRRLRRRRRRGRPPQPRPDPRPHHRQHRPRRRGRSPTPSTPSTAPADHDHDAATARAHQAGADTWPARLLLIDAAHDPHPVPGPAAGPPRTPTPAPPAPASSSPAPRPQHRRASSSSSPAPAGSGSHTPGWTWSPSGSPATKPEAARPCSPPTEHLHDDAIPVDRTPPTGWRAFTDEAGALRARAHPSPGTPREDRPGRPAAPPARRRRRGLPAGCRHHQRGPGHPRPPGHRTPSATPFRTPTPPWTPTSPPGSPTTAPYPG